VPVGPAPAAAVPVDTEEPPAEAAAPQRPAPAAKRTRAESDSARSSRARRTGRPVATGVSLSTAELADASGLTSDEIANLESYGLITGKTVAGVRCFDEEGLIVARLSAAFAQHGIEPRHLRTFKHAAAREAGLFEQIVTPLLRQRNPEARSRAEDVLGELTELGGSLRSALLRAALRDLTG
jgi:hypothetical protein